MNHRRKHHYAVTDLYRHNHQQLHAKIILYYAHERTKNNRYENGFAVAKA